MLKNIDNENNGITLIALVITIIVLLILAGVSISMLSGDNNILKRAGEAKDKTELESLKEEAKIVKSNRILEKTTMRNNSKTLKEDLEAGINNGEVEEITKADGTTKYTDVCYVSKNGQTITVYEDGEVVEGKVSIWKGATDIECPKFEKDANKENVWNWYIETAGQLKFLADFVNNGDGTTLPEGLTNYVTQAGYDPSTVTMSTDTTIYLMNNLDLGARPGEGTTDEEKWATNPDSLKWMPIGINYNNVQNKLGTFEGNNYSICGVYVNREEPYSGIFGWSNTIQNLTIKNSYIQGNGEIGGIVGRSNEMIQNCHNENSIVIDNNTGDSRCGGIAGFVYGDVGKCSNSGKIKGEGYAAGIAGFVYGDVEKCSNSGEINGQTFVGGIAGFIYTSTMRECNNTGTIKGYQNIGAIAGMVSASSNLCTINECNNNGAIEGKRDVGGIVGQANTSCTISECNNKGAIKGEGFVGGIAGRTLSTISKCINTASVTGIAGTGGEGLGGIAGHAALVVTRCCNTGSISGIGNSSTGGIVGRCVSNQGQDISLCYNSGEVKGDGDVGGISGKLGSLNADPSPKEYKCYNKGKVINTANLTNITGGIAGSMTANANVTNCYYLSSVGVNQGIGSIGEGGDLEAQNREAKVTDIDLKTFAEFIIWIEQQ